MVGIDRLDGRHRPTRWQEPVLDRPVHDCRLDRCDELSESAPASWRLHGPSTKQEWLIADLKQGFVSVAIPDHIVLPAEAGELTSKDMQRLEKARQGVGLTCDATATAIEKDPQRLAVPGVDPAKLRAAGKVAEDIDLVITDLEVILARLKQGNILLDAAANLMLRKCLAHVRSQEKFDAQLASLVPQLEAYFANTPPEPKPT